MVNKNINVGQIKTDGGNAHIGDIIHGIELLTYEFNEELAELHYLLNSFKIQTALELITSLRKRVESSDIKDKNKILSKILYIEALCKRELALDEVINTAQLFIKAYKLNEDDLLLKKNACVEYLNLGENDKAIELADEILKLEDYDLTAWQVKTMCSDDYVSFSKKVPKVVREDFLFNRMLIYRALQVEDLKSFSELENFDLSYNFDISNFDTLTLDNKKSWIIEIDIIASKMINSGGLKYIHGSNFMTENEVELQQAIIFIQKYISSLEKTELSDCIWHQKFYFFYLKYIQTNEVEFSTSLEEAYNNLKYKQWFHCQALFQVLNHQKEYEKALDYLDQIKGNDENFLDYYLLRIPNLSILKRQSEIIKSFKCYIKECKLIREIELYNIVNVFFQFIEENDIDEELEKLLLEQEFHSDDLKILLELCLKIFISKSINHSDELKLFALTGANDLHLTTKIIIAEQLVKIGKKQKAIEYLEQFVDLKKISDELAFYLQILYELIIDHKTETQGKSKELLEGLEFYRKNTQNPDYNLLTIEHNFIIELGDWKKLLQIDRILYENFPSEHTLFYLLLALDRNGDKDGIENTLKNSNIKVEDEYYGIKIIEILSLNKILPDKAFQIIYSLAKNRNNAQARLKYFTSSLFISNFFENYDKVENGNWVEYLIDGQVHKKKINSYLSNDLIFLNKEIGEKFTFKANLGNDLHEVEILSIYNDAMDLFKDIQEETNDPMNNLGLRKLQLPNNNPDDINDFLIRNFGASGTEEKIYKDEQIKRYYKYHIGFTEVVLTVFRNNYFDAYFYLTGYTNSKFTTIPVRIFENNIELNSEFILDYSTLILFYHLDKELSIKFDIKFTIPHCILKFLENSIIEEENSPNTSFMANITLDGVTAHEVPDNQKELRLNFYVDLKRWIADNCNVDYVPEKLDTIPKLLNKNKQLQNSVFKNLVDFMYLSQRENANLISSDSTLFLFNYTSGIKSNILSPEKFILENYPEVATIEFYRFLLKCNYIGIDINIDTLREEFFDFLVAKNNNYPLALENLRYIYHNNFSKINMVVDFIKEIYLHQSITTEQAERYALDLLRNALTGMSKEQILNVNSIIDQKFNLLGTKKDSCQSIFIEVVKSLF